MARAMWNGQVLAESDDLVEVEGNLYFPRACLHEAHFRPSSHQTQCGWKGTASYFDLVVNGEVNGNAAWYYPSPKPAAAQIAGRVAFWKGVKVER